MFIRRIILLVVFLSITVYYLAKIAYDTHVHIHADTYTGGEASEQQNNNNNNK